MDTDTGLKCLAVVGTIFAALAAYLSSRAAERSAEAAEESHNLSRQLAAERKREAEPHLRPEAKWRWGPKKVEGKPQWVRVSVSVSNLSSRGNTLVGGTIAIRGATEPTMKKFEDLPLVLAPYQVLKLRDVVFMNPPDARHYRWDIELKDIFRKKHVWPPAGREVKT